MIVAGIGCRRSCPADDIVALVSGFGGADALAAPDWKREEAGLLEAARILGLPLHFVSRAMLQAVQPLCPSWSAAALGAVGFASVAEAAALALGGRLLHPKATSGAATCALTETDSIAVAGPLAGRPTASTRGTVHFIGAGPGAADLITLRGARLLAACTVCLYAGSLVPAELLAHCPPHARLVDTAPLDLDAIEAEFLAATAAGQDVARLHSGDLSLYSAVAEQLRRCERLGIPTTLTPGVPAFAAAAAVLGRELTVPGLAQTVVLTRLPGRASAMPPSEQLAAYAATGATLAIHLAAAMLGQATAMLLPFYGADCPCALVVRASWPDQRLIRATLGTLDATGVERTALLLVGPALEPGAFGESALYSPDYRRRYRS